MQIRTISQCVLCDFQPVRNWPQALPAFCWDKILLTGADRAPDSPAIDLKKSEVSLSQALMACYQSFTLAELARLKNQLEGIIGLEATHVTLQELSEQCGIKFHSDSLEILTLLSQMPIIFQNWSAEREVSLGDLICLKSISPEKLNQVSEAIAHLRCSRSLGVQILELSCELLLLDKDVSELIPSADQGPETWLQHLKAWRRPRTAAYDKEMQAKVKDLPWPKYLQARWVRQGDKAQIEIKFSVANSADLQKKIHGLEKMAEHFQQLTTKPLQ